jgi:hypothetical protein
MVSVVVTVEMSGEGYRNFVDARFGYGPRRTSETAMTTMARLLASSWVFLAFSSTESLCSEHIGELTASGWMAFVGSR